MRRVSPTKTRYFASGAFSLSAVGKSIILATDPDITSRTNIVHHKFAKVIWSCLVALLCFGAAASAQAQSRERGWEWQNPLPQGNAISAIEFAKDMRHGWAVGADGVILYTSDGGFSWT